MSWTTDRATLPKPHPSTTRNVVTPSSSSSSTARAAPCDVESQLWRECMKEYDYTPDRPRGECEKQRSRYYKCINTWRESEGINKTKAKKTFEMEEKCAVQAEKLHACMMINAFEAAKCEKWMMELKRCNAASNPSVAQALKDDAPFQEYMDQYKEEKFDFLRLLGRFFGRD